MNVSIKTGHTFTLREINEKLHDHQQRLVLEVDEDGETLARAYVLILGKAKDGDSA